MIGLLPRGGSLSEEAWVARHRAVLVLLWLHVPVIAGIAFRLGLDLLHIAVETSAVALLAATATWSAGRRLRTATATAGLLTCSAVLVHLSGGVIEVHFHFFVMMAVVTMYQDWLPFLLAVGYVVVHHGVVGVLDPSSVFNHADAWRDPWRWAAIHGGFILAASAAGIISWRMHEDVQEQVRRAQEQFKDAFDNAPVGMGLVDLEGKWLQVNRALCDITGYSPAGLLARTFQDITHPDDLESDLAMVRRLLAGEMDNYQLEKRYVHSDGHAIPIQLIVTLVKDQRGAPQYFISQIQDVTERMKAEEYYRRLYEGQAALVRELQEAHRLKSELFNIVSHEFKTPLAGIIGFTGLLSSKGERLTEEQRDQYLQTIARQAERLNRLVENLFLSARQIEPQREATGNVEEAIEAVRAQLSDTYDDVRFDVTVSGRLRPKIAQEALRLVLLNLASNAVKHASPNSAVVVVAWREGESVAISVTNMGEPIPQEVRERIFEPFTQSEAAARTAEGVGLGLHIVQKLVVAYGGTVELDSEDRRVTFTIRIPESQVGREVAPPPPPPAQPVELRKSGRVA